MKQRIRIKGPHGDINKDVEVGPVAIKTSSLACNHVRSMTEAVPPKKENLAHLNTETASKQDPDVLRAFLRRSIK